MGPITSTYGSITVVQMYVTSSQAPIAVAGLI